MDSSRKLHLFLLSIGIVVLIWSGINPYDRFTWVLEVLPAVLGGVILAAIYPKFRFTNMVYIAILIHAVILMIGGKYTYAKVPLFDWIRDAFELSRNHYDRIGHLAQGFFPALVGREILIRKSPLKTGKWLSFLTICFCLAFSAFYELIEWWVAVFTGESAEAFLGTQGDVWDSQWDMFLALIGACCSVAFLSKWHDKQINKLNSAV